MISVDSGAQGAIRDALNQAGWLDEEVVAAGQLRQGKAPTMLAMIVGWALWELIRPRRSKLLPRQFVMALTPTRAVAFKAVGGSGESSSSAYIVRIFDGEDASFPRSSVTMDDVPEGAKSKGGMMAIDGERFPVARPNLSGDPNTDELIAALAGLETDAAGATGAGAGAVGGSSAGGAGEAPSGGGLIT